MTLPRHDLHSMLTTARGTCYTTLTMLPSTGQTATRHATREPTTVALRHDGGRRSDLAATPRRLQLFRHRGRHDVFYTLASPRYHGNTNRHGTTNTGERRIPFLHSDRGYEPSVAHTQGNHGYGPAIAHGPRLRPAQRSRTDTRDELFRWHSPTAKSARGRTREMLNAPGFTLPLPPIKTQKGSASLHDQPLRRALEVLPAEIVRYLQRFLPTTPQTVQHVEG